MSRRGGGGSARRPTKKPPIGAYVQEERRAKRQLELNTFGIRHRSFRLSTGTFTHATMYSAQLGAAARLQRKQKLTLSPSSAQWHGSSRLPTCTGTHDVGALLRGSSKNKNSHHQHRASRHSSELRLCKQHRATPRHARTVSEDARPHSSAYLGPRSSDRPSDPRKRSGAKAPLLFPGARKSTCS